MPAASYPILISTSLPDFSSEPPPHAFPANNQVRIAKRIAIQLVSYPPATYAFRGQLNAFEFIWPIDGAIEIFADHTAAPNQLALLTPGKRCVFATGQHHVRAVTVQFQIDRYPRTWRTHSHWPSLRSLPDADICRPLLCYLLTHAKSRNPLIIRPALTMLLSAFITGQVVYHAPAAPAFPAVLIRALDYIRRKMTAEPHHPFTPTEVAAAVGICRGTLDKYCKRFLHHTPMKEIYLARLDRAVHMLARTDYPIAVIAAMTGFCSDAQFFVHCRAQFGCCPTFLRKALHDGTQPYPTPRSPMLTGPIFAPVPPPTPIPPESLPYPPGRAQRRYRQKKRRREMIKGLTGLFRRKSK